MFRQGAGPWIFVYILDPGYRSHGFVCNGKGVTQSLVGDVRCSLGVRHPVCCIEAPFVFLNFRFPFGCNPVPKHYLRVNEFALFSPFLVEFMPNRQRAAALERTMLLPNKAIVLFNRWWNWRNGMSHLSSQRSRSGRSFDHLSSTILSKRLQSRASLIRGPGSQRLLLKTAVWASGRLQDGDRITYQDDDVLIGASRGWETSDRYYCSKKPSGKTTSSSKQRTTIYSPTTVFSPDFLAGGKLSGV